MVNSRHSHNASAIGRSELHFYRQSRNPSINKFEARHELLGVITHYCEVVWNRNDPNRPLRSLYRKICNMRQADATAENSTIYYRLKGSDSSCSVLNIKSETCVGNDLIAPVAQRYFQPYLGDERAKSWGGLWRGKVTNYNVSVRGCHDLSWKVTSKKTFILRY